MAFIPSGELVLYSWNDQWAVSFVVNNHMKWMPLSILFDQRGQSQATNDSIKSHFLSYVYTFGLYRLPQPRHQAFVFGWCLSTNVNLKIIREYNHDQGGTKQSCFEALYFLCEGSLSIYFSLFC